MDTSETEIFGVMSSLFVPDSDKRKSLSLHVKVFYDNGRDIGTFNSNPIRIISKPSKKKIKHSAGPSDWTIDLTDEIALFSRIRVSAVRICQLY